MPTYQTSGRQVQTDFAVNFTGTINLGSATNKTVVGWLKTVAAGERPGSMTLGGQTVTLGNMESNSTVFGGVGFFRKFKLVNTTLTGSQTFSIGKVDGGGSPVSVSNMQMEFIVYDGAVSIGTETDTAKQTGVNQTTTVASASGELVLWSAFSDITQNSGANATATGSSGTTVRGGSYNYTYPTVFAEEAGAASTTLNFTIANSFTPSTFGVVYTLQSSTTGTAPSITTQPVNQSVTEPTAATFSVVATGTGTLTYQWERNPTGATSFSPISGATSSSYTTPATTVTGGSANNTDTYRVVVTGDTAPPATSTAALLTVTAAPANTPFSPRAPYIRG